MASEIKPIDALCDGELLLWAFKKVKRHYYTAEGILDLAALAKFELDLEFELRELGHELRSGHFKLSPLKLSPIPKKLNEESGKYEQRQYFEVSVRDQVAWAAMATVIGPELDDKMPAWSYGHRLFRPAWFEADPGTSNRDFNLGPYRHASGQLYRPFKGSWPLYKRHALLAARLASGAKVDETVIAEGDWRAFLIGTKKGEVPFLSAAYWRGAGGVAYHGSVDLEKFYPSIHTSLVEDVVRNKSWVRSDSTCMRILRSMLDFRVSANGHSSETMKELNCKEGRFTGLPTGLMTAGLLSNIAMMHVDQWARHEAPKARVAHLRFVDDHAFIAQSFSQLVEWIERYREKLDLIGLKVKSDKTEPIELREYLVKRNRATRQKAAIACKVDVNAPNRLLTATLERVSKTAVDDADFLTVEEQGDRLSQIQFLLRAKIPDAEIREDTRFSFSAGRVNRLLPTLKANVLGLATTIREIQKIKRQIEMKEAAEGRNASTLSLRMQLQQQNNRRKKVEEKLELQEHSTFARLETDMIAPVIRYPYKGRLWQHLITFYRVTGLSGVGKIPHYLAVSCKDIELRKYTSALLLQLIANNIMRAVQSVYREDVSVAEKQSARAFLLHVLSMVKISTLVRWSGSQGNRPIALLRAATEVAIIVLKSEGDSGQFTKGFWSQKSRKLDTATAFWMLDRAGTFAWESSAVIWKHTLDRAIVDSDESRILIRLAPPGIVEQKHVIGCHLSTAKGRTGLKQDDGGWVIDIMSATDRRPRAIPPRIRIVQSGRSHHNHTHPRSLFQWMRTCARYLDDFDPRLSEWSSLEVVAQISRKLDGLEVTELHPANVILGDSWWWQGDAYSSWDEWRNATQKTVLLVPKNARVRDRRFATEKTETSIHPDAGYVFGLAILLVGMIRGSFDRLPTSGASGQSPMMGTSYIRGIVSEPISSLTSEIILGSLLPRMKETALFDAADKIFVKKGSSDDTQHEPDPIVTIRDLQRAIARSQNVLTKGQVALAGNDLRQLVPINLVSFAKALPELDKLNEA